MVEDEQNFLTLKFKKKDRDPRNHLETIRRINKIIQLQGTMNLRTKIK